VRKRGNPRIAKSTKAGRSIVAAAREVLAHLKGEKTQVRVTNVWVADVKEIRHELAMSH
jgi:hypothetical protein